MEEPEEKKRFDFHKIKKYGLYCLVFLILISVAFSTHTFVNLSGGEWVCIAKQCDEWLEGDEWITKNCRPLNNTLMCEIEYQGQKYKVPLTEIDTENVKSCNHYACVAKIYIRATDELRREE